MCKQTANKFIRIIIVDEVIIDSNKSVFQYLGGVQAIENFSINDMTDMCCQSCSSKCKNSVI